ncbi:hypothetical protein [Streptomyces sp. NPDC091217]|uniref:hypothetical protein n=1 Tax=Streptomyces sp. NPDC091217 TaxID=3365975 RepID=UPI00380B9A62
MLTRFDAETYLLPALPAGAHGFLLKDAQPGEVLDAVRNTAAGRHALAPRRCGTWWPGRRPRRPRPRRPGWTRSPRVSGRCRRR